MEARTPVNHINPKVAFPHAAPLSCPKSTGGDFQVHTMSEVEVLSDTNLTQGFPTPPGSGGGFQKMSFHRPDHRPIEPVPLGAEWGHLRCPSLLALQGRTRGRAWGRGSPRSFPISCGLISPVPPTEYRGDSGSARRGPFQQQVRLACAPGPLPALSAQAGQGLEGLGEGQRRARRKENLLGGRNRGSTHHSCQPARLPDACARCGAGAGASPTGCFLSPIAGSGTRRLPRPSSQRPSGHDRTRALPTAQLL